MPNRWIPNRLVHYVPLHDVVAAVDLLDVVPDVVVPAGTVVGVVVVPVAGFVVRWQLRRCLIGANFLNLLVDVVSNF